MKKILSVIIICICALNSFAQNKWNDDRWQKIILERRPAEIRISAQLYQLAKLAAVDLVEANE